MARAQASTRTSGAIPSALSGRRLSGARTLTGGSRLSIAAPYITDASARRAPCGEDVQAQLAELFARGDARCSVHQGFLRRDVERSVLADREAAVGSCAGRRD